MVSGCAGIINDRIYAVTPSNNFFSVDSTFLNGTLVNTGCPPVPSFAYSTCTVISNPPTIVTVGTDSHGLAGTRLLQFSSSGSCQLSEKWYSITGMALPVSVVPASCDSQTSVPCFAVLGLSSTTGEYIIDYPTSFSFTGANPLIVGPGNSDMHPVLAMPPKDASKMYVIGSPTKDQIMVFLNNGNNSTMQSSVTPSLFGTTTTNALSTPTLGSATSLPSNGNGGVILHRRAESSNSPNIVNAAAESYIKLNAPIENTGQATTVGGNIVIVSSNSLTVQMIPASSSSLDILPVTNLNIPPSSQIQNANSLKGIDSLVPLPAQNGDSSTVWINYEDGNGHYVQTSTQQPGLFTEPSPATTSIPDAASSNPNSGSSLSTGAMVGIIIGSIVGFILLALLCFYLWRKQRRSNRQRQHLGGGGNNRHISLTDQRCLTEKTASTPTTYISTPNKDDATSAIIITPMDPVHHDDSIDDTPSLASLTQPINNHTAPPNDTYYEPTSTNETLLLNSVAYHLHNESPSYALFPQGYATRSATRTHNGQLPTECTIHYFPASSANWVRHLLHTNSGIQAHHRTNSAAQQNDNNDETMMTVGLHTYEAISLSTPTQNGHYQYIWITSPFHLDHTLYSLLFEGGNAVVDCQQFSFKAWSTLSMLQSLDALHQMGWIHRKLNTSCFFYDQASSVTDWRLLGLYQSIWYTGLIDKNMELARDEYTAPECFDSYPGRNSLPRVSLPSMDIWSLGCVLYSVATGKRAFQNMNEYQALLRSGRLQAKLDTMMDEAALVDESYKHILRRMLQINPGARDSLTNIISYWIQANQLDDDE